MNRVSCDGTDAGSLSHAAGVREAAGGEFEKLCSLLRSKLGYFFVFVYKVMYLTGMRQIRIWRRFRRMMSRQMGCLGKWCGRHLGNAKAGFLQYLHSTGPARTWRHIKEELHELRERFTGFFHQSHTKRALAVCHGARFGLRYALKLAVTVFHYACPAAAIGLLVYTVQYFTSLPYALSVEYDGRNIGYITDESVFDAAQKNVKDRIIYEEYKQPEDTVPQFRLVVADGSKLTGTDKLTDEIILASGNDIVEADGLYIDNEFIGATTDGDSMLLMLNALKEPYRDMYPDAQIEFNKKIRIAEGLYPVSSVVELNTIETTINSEVEGERVYTVKTGDVPITIAKQNDVTLEDLRMLNPDIDKTLLPGQELLISKSVPLLSVRATRKRTYTEEIPFKITEEVDNTQTRGWSKVITEGSNGLQEIQAEEIYEDGVMISRNILNTVVLDEPVNQVVKVGGSTPSLSSYSWSGSRTSNAFSTQAPNTSGYIWPVGGTGGFVSCPLYGYTGHTGMDIAVDTGTPVYAVAGGTVKISRQAPGYGKYIVIDHGNGMTTWYLHNSVLYVSPGQTVSQGQVISASGQTGNVTGPHLHIEFRMNGAVLNPASFIGYRGR